MTENKKTKEQIILRELDFQIGDTIHLSNISLRTIQNEVQLMRKELESYLKKFIVVDMK